MTQLQPTLLDNRLRAAEAVVREAGRLAADHFARRELLSIDRKGAQDLVSEADRECEDLIVAGLSRLFPEDGFLGEERGSRNPDASAVWVIDPIDGTHNFLTGVPSDGGRALFSEKRRRRLSQRPTDQGERRNRLDASAHLHRLQLSPAGRGACSRGRCAAFGRM
jgi:hypothetical protein